MREADVGSQSADTLKLSFRGQLPEKYAVLEPLGEQAKAGAIPEHDFDEVGLPTPEQEEMAREGILPQHALHQHRQPVDALAHIDEAESEVTLHAPRKQRHDACSSVGRNASVISLPRTVGPPASVPASNGTGQALRSHSSAL